MHSTLPLIVNFGGPRHLNEIKPFLQALLTDRDVIRTKLPRWLEKPFFLHVAKKRALQIKKDYELIGGKSPIFEDTEWIREQLDKMWERSCLTFHRYLEDTHNSFIEQIENTKCSEIRVFPLFPQFSYATTGSIARWFNNHLSKDTLHKMRWVASYASHDAYILSMKTLLREFLEKNHLNEEETSLFFSAHGLPKKFVEDGDIYEKECQNSFSKIAKQFPNAVVHLAYQSKFGKGEWLRPYTNESCESILSWNKGRKNVVFIPLSFPTDHIETLFEIEYQYLPLVRERGLRAFRCPALNRHVVWLEAIAEIFDTADCVTNDYLIRATKT